MNPDKEAGVSTASDGLLKPCRECKNPVSITAGFCPKCGAKKPALSAAGPLLESLGQGLMGVGCLLTLLITIPVLFFLLVLGAC